jgi:hypothetical protein
MSITSGRGANILISVSCYVVFLSICICNAYRQLLIGDACYYSTELNAIPKIISAFVGRILVEANVLSAVV